MTIILGQQVSSYWYIFFLCRVFSWEQKFHPVNLTPSLNHAFSTVNTSHISPQNGAIEAAANPKLTTSPPRILVATSFLIEADPEVLKVEGLDTPAVAELVELPVLLALPVSKLCIVKLPQFSRVPLWACTTTLLLPKNAAVPASVER